MHQSRRSVFILLIATSLFLSGCGAGRSSVTQQTPPEAAAETAVAARSMDDSIDRMLADFRLRIDRAERHLEAGRLADARGEFESGMALLEGYTGPSRIRADREIALLRARMGAMDAVGRPGETVPEYSIPEHAVIDDLAELDVSGLEIDPGLRDQAEAEVETLDSELPIELHARVLSFLEYYARGRGRSTMVVGLERMGLYAPMIHRILEEEGVPQELIHLAQAESLFKAEALSRAQAKGMWQFISARGAEYGLRQTWWLEERSDPEKSTRAAARHLRDLYDEFGDWYLAMAAYNAGPGRVRRGIAQSGQRSFWALADRNLLPAETRNYVPTILAMVVIAKNPGEYGFDVTPSPAQEVERVRERNATDIRVIAEQLGISADLIRDLNPHILRWATPPDDDEFELRLPAGYTEAYARNVAPLPESQRILFREHRVSAGETVSYIARRYGVSIEAISQSNRLSRNHLIRIGQVLVIPVSGVPAPGGAVAATVPESGSRPEIYTVGRGDTLSSISARYGISVAAIQQWNGMSSDRLLVGQTLRLRSQDAAQAETEGPERIVYNVRPGDTLTRIATSHQTSVDAIRAWNQEADLSIIRPGDRITIYMQR